MTDQQFRQLRIGDAEREAAARELGEHYAQGRITTDEHSERLDRIWAARTAADLAPAFADLPRPRPEPVPSPRRGPRGPRAWQARVADVVSPMPFLLKVLIGVVVIALVIAHLPLVLVAVLFYVLCVRRLAHRRPRGPRWH